MFLKLSKPFKKFVKATKIWRQNSFIYYELKSLRWLSFLAVFSLLVSAILAGSTIGFIGVFLQGLTNPNELFETGIVWFDRAVLATQAPGAERLLRVGIVLLAVIWVQAAFQYVGLFTSNLVAIKLVDQLRKTIFSQLQRLSLSYYTKVPSGALINTLITETQKIQQAFIVLSNLFVQIFRLAVYVALMLMLSWQLTVGAFMGFSLLSVGISFITRKIRKASLVVPGFNQQVTSTGLEFINGIRTIHASASQDFERRHFLQAAEKLLRAQTRVKKLTEFVRPLSVGVSSTMLVALVLISSVTLLDDDRLNVASLLTFLFALSRTMPIVSNLNNFWAKFSGFQGSFYNVREFLERDGKPYLKNGSQKFESLFRAIDLVDVDFSYDSQETVLYNITLSIRKGQTIALVGASGAGKSTLVDLLPRFYDPTGGVILFDGVDLRTLDINSVREKMSIVSQDTFIFNKSVRDNIAYALHGVSDDDILEAARQANALDFIQELDDGLDTQLGDRGVLLSGGQRQRIAIARAILRDPEILILDEATSALDSITEKLIQDSFEKLSQGRTVIAIAHRLSTIANADQIVVLENGRIVEQGKYQELLEQRGKLWNYHQIQYEAGTAS